MHCSQRVNRAHPARTTITIPEVTVWSAASLREMLVISVRAPATLECKVRTVVAVSLCNAVSANWALHGRWVSHAMPRFGGPIPLICLEIAADAKVSEDTDVVC